MNLITDLEEGLQDFPHEWIHYHLFVSAMDYVPYRTLQDRNQGHMQYVFLGQADVVQIVVVDAFASPAKALVTRIPYDNTRMEQEPQLALSKLQKGVYHE